MSWRAAEVLIASTLLALFVGCTRRSQDTVWRGRVDSVDGVTVVSNPKAPLYRPTALTLREDLEIADSGTAPEPAFTRAWYIAVNEEGEIFVMDQGDACVKVFDNEGAPLRRIGRKGQGPGELQNPNSIHVTKDGRLIFEDFLRGLNVFDRTGRFLTFLPAAAFVDILVTPDGRIVARVNTVVADRPGKEIHIFDSAFRQLAAFGFLPDEPRNPQVVKPYAGRFSWALTSDNDLAVTYDGAYEINVLSLDGRLQKRIRKEHDPVKITREEIFDVTKRLRGRTAEFPTAHPAVQGLWADDEGRIYVKTYERTDDGRSLYYDVFDRDGRCLVKRAIPESIRPQVWKSGKMYAIEEDTEGRQRIKRYQLVWSLGH
jgi:hypothetical protein